MSLVYTMTKVDMLLKIGAAGRECLLEGVLSNVLTFLPIFRFPETYQISNEETNKMRLDFSIFIGIGLCLRMKIVFEQGFGSLIMKEKPPQRMYFREKRISVYKRIKKYSIRGAFV